MNIPEKIIDLIMSFAFSTSSKIPEHIVDKIMLYNSHPVADLFKQEFNEQLNFYTAIQAAVLQTSEQETFSFHSILVENDRIFVNE